MKFSEKLYRLRKREGLSQEELGDKLNVTRQTISKWELDQTKPDSEKLMEISKLFNISLEDFTDESKLLDNLPTNNTTTDSAEYIDPHELKPRRWLLVVLIILALIISVILIDKIITDRKNSSSNSSSSIMNTIKNVIDSGSNQSNMIRNSQIEMYIGTEYGSSISSLLDIVIKNNKTNKEHLLTVVYQEIRTTDPEEIKNLKKNFETFTKYETSVDYDENNIVSVITIEDITNNSNSNTSTNNSNISNSNSNTNTSNSNNSINDEFNKKSFNNKFELYNGTKSGFFVKSMIDQVITNNKTNSHILTVSFAGISGTSENDFNLIRNKLSDWTEYNVSFSYGSDGYITKINISEV